MNTSSTTSSAVPRLVSFVIPAKDEAPTLPVLLEKIAASMAALERPHEVIFIDDGSRDDTWRVMQNLASENPETVRAVRMRRNVGKARALAVGFERARGEIVFTLDADLQDDPDEIPRFLEKLAEGYDIVSGYKQKRHDPWHKVLPSRVFNLMLSRVNGVRLHDHNCGFKCYRSEVVKSFTLYGEMHRMVPSLGSIEGFRSGEIVVRHHPRVHGQSKYGIKRFLRGFLDMCTVAYLKNYAERPLHLWGGLALVLLACGGALAAASLFLSPSARGVALVGALTLGAAALGSAAIGFLSELLVSNRRVDRPENRVSEDSGVPRADEDIPDNLVRFDLPAPASSRALGPAESVLVVDDAVVERMLAAHHLAREGYALQEASDGEEALEKIQSDTAVVVLDLRMPRMDGMAFLNRLRAKNPHTRVIISSSATRIDTAVRTMKLGAFDYLEKPVAPEALKAAVRSAADSFRVSRNYHAMAL